MSILLVDLESVEEGSVVKRPSKQCKTPYVADIRLENGEEILGLTVTIRSPGWISPCLADTDPAMHSATSTTNSLPKFPPATPPATNHQPPATIPLFHDFPGTQK